MTTAIALADDNDDELARLRLERDQLAEQLRALQAPAAARPTSLYECHLAHIDALRHQHRAAATLTLYSIYAGGFIAFVQDRGIAQPTLEHLTPAWLMRYQDHVASRGFGARGGAAAERTAVKLVKTFANWLWRRGLIDADPLLRVEPPRLTKLHREPFSKDDCLRLLEAVESGPDPVMERALLLLGLDTGCRIGELVATDVDDVDLAAGSILFRRTKNSRQRKVFFRVADRPDGGPCVVALQAWLEARPRRLRLGDLAPSVKNKNAHALFLHADGLRLTTGRARNIYRMLGVAASVPHCFPHRSRHTAASEFLTELPGAELHLRNRLGHLSHEVLADYVSISDSSAMGVVSDASISAKWGL